MRQLERHEESYMRQILSAPRSCPLSQLYLEVGMYPARYETMRLRLLFLKYILSQHEESIIYKFFKLQEKYMIKGNWVSMCYESLNELNIQYSFDKIKSISLNTFKSLLKQQISISALKYLLKIRKSKGQEIEYNNLQMSDYLKPNKVIKSIDDKKFLFSLRNKTNFIINSHNTNKILCLCKQEITKLTHVYECLALNVSKIEVTYDRVYNGTLIEQRKILIRMKENINKIQQNV